MSKTILLSKDNFYTAVRPPLLYISPKYMLGRIIDPDQCLVVERRNVHKLGKDLIDIYDSQGRMYTLVRKYIDRPFPWYSNMWSVIDGIYHYWIIAEISYKKDIPLKELADLVYKIYVNRGYYRHQGGSKKWMHEALFSAKTHKELINHVLWYP